MHTFIATSKACKQYYASRGSLFSHFTAGYLSGITLSMVKTYETIDFLKVKLKLSEHFKNVAVAITFLRLTGFDLTGIFNIGVNT